MAIHEKFGVLLQLRHDFYGRLYAGLRKDSLPGHDPPHWALGTDYVPVLRIGQDWPLAGQHLELAIDIVEHELLHYLLGHLTPEYEIPETGQYRYYQSCDKEIMQLRNGGFQDKQLRALSEGTRAFGGNSQTIMIEIYKNIINQEENWAGHPDLYRHKRWRSDFLALPTAVKVLVRAAIRIHCLATLEAYDSRAEEYPLSAVAQQVRRQLLRPEHSATDWRPMLRRVVAGHLRQGRRPGRRRPSRRYPEARGLQPRRSASLLVAVDTSGSVPEFTLSIFWGEIQRLARQGFMLEIIEFDHRIRRRYRYTRGITPQVYGRGGTSFRPLWRLPYPLGRYAGLLVFTDGFASPPPTVLDIPVFWVFSPNGIGPQDPLWEAFPGQKIKMQTHE